MGSALQAGVAANGRAEKQPLLPDALARLGAEELLVNEFFLSIQGESTFAGLPCFFIRLTGCHLRCVWCDSEYAFHEGSVFTIDECVERTLRSGARLAELTGGEPLIQSAARPLIARLADEGLRVLVETSGAVSIDGIDPRAIRIVDVKCPGSGMQDKNRPSIERALRSSDELKFVLADRPDYEWARSWIRERLGTLPAGIPIHLSPVFGRLKADDLAAWLLEDRLPVRLNLQIHKFIWDPKRRGV